MIPKVIHCCWLSGGPKTELAKRCLASWRHFAPECEIREWTLADFPDASALPPFFAEAVRQRKWAFAADWLRFYVLYERGGVYFDLDFELVGRFVPDSEFVAGQWMPDGRVGMEPAAIALEKGSPIAAAMMDCYAKAAFDNRTTVGEILQTIPEAKGLRVLPPEVMSPIDIEGRVRRTEKTVGVHWCAMSWCGPRRKLARWLNWHGLRPLVDLFLRLKR